MVLALYLFALVGLGTSSLLVVDYLRTLPVFCDGGGGCDVVRQSEFAHLLGLPTPVFGVAFFIGVFLLALWPARRVLIAWSAAGALAALAFLGIQAFVLHAFCKFCVVADTSTLIVFALALVTRKHETPKRIFFVGLAASAVTFAPLVYARTLPPSPPPEYVQVGAPEVIQRLQQPGVATIVEFVDFECPFCRRLHQTMQDVLKDYEGKVRVVRKQHPLAMHAHALDAARAACCADEAGRGDEMADALYHAPPEDLTAEGCEKLAASIGIDVSRYRQCFASDDTTQRLAADAADARAAGLREEAPVFWIGDVRYRGALPADMIRMGIDRALKGF